MSKLCKIVIDGVSFNARQGEVLLDAALSRGVDLKHDCRAGRCGRCHLEVVEGRVLGDGGTNGATVAACRSRVLTDIVAESLPTDRVTTVAGRVASLRRLAPTVVEVAIAPVDRIEIRAGQYLEVAFAGFPVRCYSPAPPLDGRSDNGLIRLHIQQLAGGAVSSAIGREIGTGHKVTLRGPFGSAYYRDGRPQRHVMIGGGTGFAPIWAVAREAIDEAPRRPLVMIVGVRTEPDLYMLPALRFLCEFDNVHVIPMVSNPRGTSKALVGGRPTDFLHWLDAGDIVYAAGAPGMVDAIGVATEDVGATFYADPFVPNSNGSPAWWRRLAPIGGQRRETRRPPSAAPSERRPRTLASI